MKNGPVPIEIYGRRHDYKTDLFYFKSMGEDQYIIVPKVKEANLDYFSQYEINDMNRLIEIYADRFVFSKHISEASHQDIKAWKRTYQRKPNNIINYDLCFDADIMSKTEEDLTYVEDQYLAYKALDTLEKGKS